MRGRIAGDIYRWRKIRIQEHGATTETVLQTISRYFGWSSPSMARHREIAPDDLVISHYEGFDESARLELLHWLKERYPKAKFCFYGHQARTTIDDAVALDEFIQ